MIGKNLVELRKKAKLTQEELTKKLGIHRGTYANYEIDKREPDIETLQKIADFHGVTLDYLTGRTEQPSPVQSIKISDMTQAEIEEFINNPNIRPKYRGRELTEEEMIKLSKLLEVMFDRNE